MITHLKAEHKMILMNYKLKVKLSKCCVKLEGRRKYGYEVNNFTNLESHDFPSVYEVC